MSKYDRLWRWLRQDGRQELKLPFADIQQIAGVPLDHSFLRYKKDLSEYGYEVVKISMKEQTVAFRRIPSAEK